MFTKKLNRYCVRPNSGRIEPGKEVEVTGMCTSELADVLVLIYSPQFFCRQ
jgi:hypothetical protein